MTVPSQASSQYSMVRAEYILTSQSRLEYPMLLKGVHWLILPVPTIDPNLTLPCNLKISGSRQIYDARRPHTRV